jgi:hypothetical protein
MTNKDFQYFLKQDFTKYAGKWVAIYDQKIVSSSNSITDAIEQAKQKYKNKEFLFAKIPAKNQALIL